MLASAIVGAGLWAAAAVVAIVVGRIWFAARGIPYDTGEAASLLWPTLIAGALWAAMGVGLGFALPSQVGAIVALFAYLFVVESIVQGLLPSVHHYMPGGLLGDLHGGSDAHFSRPVATLLTLAYVVAFGLVGAALQHRRDIT